MKLTRRERKSALSKSAEPIEEIEQDDIQQEESDENRKSLLKKRKKKSKMEQIPASELIPNGKDFFSPSVIKELIPTDESIEGRSNDYYVEVGAGQEMTRYFRNFFAELSGGTTYAGMLDSLILGEFGKGDTDLAIHIDPVEKSQELHDINRRIKGIMSDLYSEGDQAKQEELKDELYDLKGQQARLRKNLENTFRVSIQACLSSNNIDDLKKYSNTMIRKFKGKEIIMRPPDGKQLESFLNLLPIRRNKTYREHAMTLESTNLADLFPFSNGTISHRSGIVWGLDPFSRPIYYDGFRSDMMNNNIVILGRSGGGKTFATLTLTNRSAHIGIRTVIIDPKGDYRKYVKKMNCPYIDLDADSEDRINFFDVDVEERAGKPPAVNLEETVNGARAIVFKMIRVLDPDILNGMTKVKIQNKIYELYEEKGITSDPESIFESGSQKITNANGQRTLNMAGKRKKMPQLSDLYILLSQDPEAHHVAELLKNFTVHGNSPSQAVFDCQSTLTLSNKPITAFGLSNLDKDVMRPIGTFIATKWQSIKFARKNRHIPKRVIFDEAQHAMNEPETAEWMENEFREMRFFQTSFCAITQGFEVFTRVENGLGILKNAPTKLFLRQEDIDIDAVKDSFDLTEWEANFLVSRANKGRGILRVEDESAEIQVDATPAEFEMFKTDHADGT